MTAGDRLCFPVGVPAPDGGLRVGAELHALSAEEEQAWRGALGGHAPGRLVALGAVVPVRLGTDAAVEVATGHRLLAWPGVLAPAHPAAPFLAECSLLVSVWAQCCVLAARTGEATGRPPDPALYLTGVLGEVHRLLALGAASLDRVRPDHLVSWPPVASRRPGGAAGPPGHWPARGVHGY